MGRWFTALGLVWTCVFGIPKGWAEASSRGFWNRSTWWCATSIGPSFDNWECSLEIAFNREGKCSWAELVYWWGNGTGLLEPLICLSAEDGTFSIYRKTDPSVVVYEGRIKGLSRDFLGRPVLQVETPQGVVHSFKKGRP